MKKEEGMDDFLKIAMLHSTGKMGDEELGALLAVKGGASPLIPVSESEKLINAKVFLETLDSKGKLLEAGKNYLFRGEKVKVLKEVFGCGNFLDRYYRVYYLGSDLEEQFTVVEVEYRGGPFGGAFYESKFEPIQSNEEEK